MKLQEIADDLYCHQKEAMELDKITKRYNGITLENAYEIQKMNIEKDLQTGDHFVGWKMGLTSKAKQKSVGVDQPIYGRLLESMKLSGGELHLDGFIHPRVEPELAFVINKRLEGTDITEQDVWQATECIMPALEIIDSRYRNFSFNLIDVVADNASSAKFLISEKAFSPNQFKWEQIPVMMKLNDKIVQEGKGSDVLEHPVRSVIELVHMLHRSGHCIEPGMIVLTGAITEAIHVSSGDVISVNFHGLGTMSLLAN
jgi:2-oxo-3-hexenedioate decarboxylase